MKCILEAFIDSIVKLKYIQFITLHCVMLCWLLQQIKRKKMRWNCWNYRETNEDVVDEMIIVMGCIF